MDGAEYLVGAAEIAEMLGVDGNTINQWKSRHSDFPKPIRVLKAASVWDVREIQRWATETGRLKNSPDLKAEL